MRMLPPLPHRSNKAAAKLARDHIIAFSLRAHIQCFAGVFVRFQVRQRQKGLCELREERDDNDKK